MKEMNICIDIDGTITEPYYWLKRVNDYFYTNVQAEDVTVYDIHKIIGIDPIEYFDFYLKNGELLHKEAQIRPGAREVINQLNNKHKIHFVTARDKIMREVTLEWMSHYNISMDTISFLGSHDKVNKAKELQSDIFIEDRLENALQLSDADLQVLLVDCNYNKGELPNNVVRVKSWREIDEWIYYYEGWNKKEIAL
ncbi:hypothetical protein [Alkalibaculum bacchi]|uniref:5' nucleotidase, NT5C type n=1 Tax=Alkalibaculum bacchi TaxID=645887 RepID=UPI0026F2354E|nr:hypothetical protein [Alkalibaculum bacchi]